MNKVEVGGDCALPSCDCVCESAGTIAWKAVGVQRKGNGHKRLWWLGDWGDTAAQGRGRRCNDPVPAPNC